MSTAAGSSPASKRKSVRFSASYLLAALPMLGIGGLLWYSAHRVTTPDISIFQAAGHGDLDAVESHIQSGTNINDISQEGQTALFYAVSARKVDVVKYLLANGARTDAEAPDKFSPLYVAAGEGDANLVNQLLAAGADPKKDEMHGMTPLLAAASSGNPEIVRELLDRGADANKSDERSGSTPLGNAALRGNLESVNLLLDHGAKVNTRGAQGRSALFMATIQHHDDVARALIAKGADADIADQSGQDGNSNVVPLSAAFEGKASSELEHLLIDNMKEFDIADWNGRSPLHYAIERRAPVEFVKALIDKGCPVNQLDSSGQTPLSLAITSGNRDEQKMLIDAGARMSLSMVIRMALAAQSDAEREKRPFLSSS